MSQVDRERWNAKYADKVGPQPLQPDEWLTATVSPLPRGRALEFACGMGHNAVWLARQGWQVDAVDISAVGLRLAAELAAGNETEVSWICADLDEYSPTADAYDLVCVLRFLDRRRLPDLIQRSLRPGGRLVYETFTTAHLERTDSRMKNPAFALLPGELPRLFPELKPISYSEVVLADRTVARLVAQRDAN